MNYIINSKTNGSNAVLRLKVLTLPAILASLLLIGGCSNSSEYEESSADMEEAQSVTEEAVDSEINGIMSKPTSDLSSNTKSASSNLSVENLSGDSEQTLASQAAEIKIAGKLLLITASADFKVEDVVKSSNAIESLTRQQGGYVALSKINNTPRDSQTFVQGDKNITLTTYTRYAEMTVRVPRVHVNKFLAQLQRQVKFLNEHQFSAQDVTLDIYREQLADQLSNDMASELSEERLKSKNDKDQGSNVDAITATYAARRQQQLAQLEQMNIADKVQYSTISLTFMQPDISYKETTQNLDVLLDAESPSFGAQVNQSFKYGWEMLKSFALGLIQIWWLVVLGGIFYLIYRIIKAVYYRFFRNDLRLKNLKRELMGEEQKNNDPKDKKSIRLNDKTESTEKTDNKRSD